jgi:predicted CoA-binding protein
MRDVAARILRDYRRVAVVGISDRPERDSHRVAAYLAQAGYVIIPVNPNVTQVLGERCWPSLDEAARADRGRRRLPPLRARRARSRRRDPRRREGGVDAGRRRERGRRRRRHAPPGLLVVMDRCMLRDHAAGLAG